MIFHILTVVLVVLKALGLITISWWWVVLPSLAVVAVAVFVTAMMIIAGIFLSK